MLKIELNNGSKRVRCVTVDELNDILKRLINDIDCLKYVGCPAAPANYHPDISKYIKLKLSKKGGQGAIRELSDIISSSLKK